MQLKQVFERIAGFTLHMATEPNKFWDDVIENKTTIRVFSQIYFPFIILAALASVIGDILSSSEILWSYSISKGIREAIVYLIYFYLAGFVMNKLVGAFGGIENKVSCQLAVGFSSVPFFIVAIITGLFPFLYAINLLGLYGFFIIYIGIPKLFNVPENRIKVFSVAVILSNFLIFAILSLLFWKLLESFY